MILRRVKSETDYMLATNSTIRQIAKVFGVSKSTVHKDLKERLYGIDRKSHESVRRILEHHTKIRHLRGGESTKKKYLNLRK